MVSRHIQDHRNVVHAVTEPFAEDAPTGDFENCEVDSRVLQHHPGRAWSAGVGLFHESPVDIDAIRGRHPDPVPETADDVRDHAGGGRFAV